MKILIPPLNQISKRLIFRNPSPEIPSASGAAPSGTPAAVDQITSLEDADKYLKGKSDIEIEEAKSFSVKCVELTKEEIAKTIKEKEAEFPEIKVIGVKFEKEIEKLKNTLGKALDSGKQKELVEKFHNDLNAKINELQCKLIVILEKQERFKVLTAKLTENLSKLPDQEKKEIEELLKKLKEKTIKTEQFTLEVREIQRKMIVSFLKKELQKMNWAEAEIEQAEKLILREYEVGSANSGIDDSDRKILAKLMSLINEKYGESINIRFEGGVDRVKFNLKKSYEDRKSLIDSAEKLISLYDKKKFQQAIVEKNIDLIRKIAQIRNQEELDIFQANNMGRLDDASGPYGVVLAFMRIQEVATKADNSSYLEDENYDGQIVIEPNLANEKHRYALVLEWSGELLPVAEAEVEAEAPAPAPAPVEAPDEPAPAPAPAPVEAPDEPAPEPAPAPVEAPDEPAPEPEPTPSPTPTVTDTPTRYSIVGNQLTIRAENEEEQDQIYTIECPDSGIKFTPTDSHIVVDAYGWKGNLKIDNGTLKFEPITDEYSEERTLDNVLDFNLENDKISISKKEIPPALPIDGMEYVEKNKYDTKQALKKVKKEIVSLNDSIQAAQQEVMTLIETQHRRISQAELPENEKFDEAMIEEYEKRLIEKIEESEYHFNGIAGIEYASRNSFVQEMIKICRKIGINPTLVNLNDSESEIFQQGAKIDYPRLDPIEDMTVLNEVRRIAVRQHVQSLKQVNKGIKDEMQPQIEAAKKAIKEQEKKRETLLERKESLKEDLWLAMYPAGRLTEYQGKKFKAAKVEGKDLVLTMVGGSKVTLPIKGYYADGSYVKVNDDGSLDIRNWFSGQRLTLMGNKLISNINGSSIDGTIEYISELDYLNISEGLQHDLFFSFLGLSQEKIKEKAEKYFDKFEKKIMGEIKTAPEQRINHIVSLERTIADIEDIDFSATLKDVNGVQVFKNEDYEKDWSTGQKFIYRREKQFPGFKGILVEQIQKLKESLHKEEFAFLENLEGYRTIDLTIDDQITPNVPDKIQEQLTALASSVNFLGKTEFNPDGTFKTLDTYDANKHIEQYKLINILIALNGSTPALQALKKLAAKDALSDFRYEDGKITQMKMGSDRLPKEFVDLTTLNIIGYNTILRFSDFPNLITCDNEIILEQKDDQGRTPIGWVEGEYVYDEVELEKAFNPGEFKIRRDKIIQQILSDIGCNPNEDEPFALAGMQFEFTEDSYGDLSFQETGGNYSFEISGLIPTFEDSGIGSLLPPFKDSNLNAFKSHLIDVKKALEEIRAIVTQRKASVIEIIKNLGAANLHDPITLREFKFTPLADLIEHVDKDTYWLKDDNRYWRETFYHTTPIRMGIELSPPHQIILKEKDQEGMDKFDHTETEGMVAWLQAKKSEIDQRVISKVDKTDESSGCTIFGNGKIEAHFVGEEDPQIFNIKAPSELRFEASPLELGLPELQSSISIVVRNAKGEIKEILYIHYYKEDHTSRIGMSDGFYDIKLEGQDIIITKKQKE